MGTPVTPDAISRAAKILSAHFESGDRSATLPPACQPASFEDAYAIQREVARRLPREVVGWKAGLTDEGLQRIYGSPGPIYGRIYAPFLLESPALVAHRPPSLTVEAEFAFRLGRELPARSSPLDVDRICEAIDAMHLAIEVVGSRMRADPANTIWTSVADNSGGIALVISPPVPGWRDRDLVSQRAIVAADDHVIAQGDGSRVLGDPRLALAWLVNALLQAGEPLRPGQVLTTGTCVGALSVAPDARIVADFPGLGQVHLAHRGRGLAVADDVDAPGSRV